MPKIVSSKKIRGFSMFEMIVALSIMAIVGATAVPLALQRVEDSKTSSAQAETENLMTAVTSFYLDMGEYPSFQAYNGDRERFLYSACQSSDPTSFVFSECWGRPFNWDGANWGATSGSEVGTLHDHLIENNNSYPAWDANRSLGWKGPYLAKDPVDPWGYQYIVSTKSWEPNRRNLWILSAGVDHALQTDDIDAEIQGDDIGISPGWSQVP